MTDETRTNQSNSTADRNSGGRDLRKRAIEAYDGARDRVGSAGRDASRKAGETISEAPLIALAGGLAAGALIAALLPKTDAEKKLLGPAGEKLGGRAREAAQAARQAGTERLKELGLTPDAGVETLKSVFRGAGDAAKTSAQAAVGTIKGE